MDGDPHGQSSRIIYFPVDNSKTVLLNNVPALTVVPCLAIGQEGCVVDLYIILGGTDPVYHPFHRPPSRLPKHIVKRLRIQHPFGPDFNLLTRGIVDTRYGFFSQSAEAFGELTLEDSGGFLL